AFAHLIGMVHGETTPSITNVTVIGTSQEDHAIHVVFESRQEGFWFTPDLVEFLDYAPGTEITLEGVPKKWVRSATGEWEETAIEQEPAVKQKPWWRLW